MYQICTRCVMDTSDPNITFDSDGVCNHCASFETNVASRGLLNDGKSASAFTSLVQSIREAGARSRYDALVGLSGGLDSSYMAYLMSKMGLRLLAMNVDTGWNTSIAVSNTQALTQRLGIPLITYTIDPGEMVDLQMAYLRSGVMNQDIPQDHCFPAVLFKYAAKEGIRYILNGSNLASESVLPVGWGYNSLDLTNLRAIHRRYGKKPLRSYPTISPWEYYIYYPYVRRIKVARPLNCVRYIISEAQEVLGREVGWESYGSKHFESVFTRFYQGHYLPLRTGYDKRRAHLSSLILSRQLTRDEALEILTSPPDNPESVAVLKNQVAERLGIGPAELDSLISLPVRSHREFPTDEWVFHLKRNILRVVGRKGR